MQFFSEGAQLSGNEASTFLSQNSLLVRAFTQKLRPGSRSSFACNTKATTDLLMIRQRACSDIVARLFCSAPYPHTLRSAPNPEIHR